MRLHIFLALAASIGACKAKRLGAGSFTCASIETLHSGVEVTGSVGVLSVQRSGRVEVAGRVRTAPEGRAIIRTDDGVELRVAGDSELVFSDGRARVDHGRVFVSSWGDAERSVGVGDAVIRLSDASLEIERSTRTTRVITVRGEVAWQQGSHQGQISQGESLEGEGALTVRPAGVWDDWTGGVASPQGVAHRGATGSGRMRAHLEDGELPAALANNEHKVSVRIDGDLAITTVEQSFFNGSERAAPVEYRMRLPPGALVATFRTEQNNAWVSAQPGIVGALLNGGAVGLVASPSGEVYANVGALSPGDTARVELTYVEWLTHDGAQRAYVYPMGDAVSPQVVGEFVLDVDVSKAGAQVVRFPEGARFETDGHVRLRRSDWRPRGDLVVDLSDAKAPALPSARAWRSVGVGFGGHSQMMVDLSLPTPALQGSDIALILDASAATSAASLEVARAAVDAVLHQVGPGDRVALLLGDLGAHPAEGAAGRMEAVTEARREAILDAIAHARAGGASDIARMIVDAHSTLDPSRNGSVFYLGDATPTVGALDPSRLLDEASRQAPDLRLYVMALGASSHPEVLRPLTRDGGMTVRMDDPSEAVAAAQSLCAHALRPCLRDVTIDLGALVSHPLPSRVRAWVAGDPLRVLGELTGTTVPKTAVVTARAGSTAQRWELALSARSVSDRGDLARRWASHRIEALALTGTGRASIAELGARFGVVTPVSGLVLGAPEGGPAVGYTFAASPWPEDTSTYRLPQLGVSGALAPRGVQTIGGGREVPIALDDEAAGWHAHVAGEGRGQGAQVALAAGLAAAEASARACVERKRLLRPGLGGFIEVSALVEADGRVSDSVVVSSSLNDAETDACIRRAVQGTSLPEPAMLGATPGRVSRRFDYATNAGPSSRVCPPTSQLPRAARLTLWRERLRATGVNWQTASTLFNNASARCELRWWEDRVALLELIVESLSDPQQVLEFRNRIDDPSAIDWLDGAIARRFGASWVWRAHAGRMPLLDWDALLTRLSAPGITPDQRVAILRAWLAVAPRDVDLRLRLMAALEEAGKAREARALGDRLRRDPIADARVRSQVAEMLLRAGDRTEALRCFTEIAEFAPYDPYARQRLGDLLLTYDWPAEAYHHYQTLAMLRPGDALPLVRVALAALASGHEDEGLRLLRRAAEESGGDASGVVAQSILDAEVARVTAQRPDDPAVRAWIRVASRLRTSRDAELALRWSHPDLGVELLQRPASETVFGPVGDAPVALGVRLWSPDTALDGTHLIVRAPVGVRGRRIAEARVQLLLPLDGSTRLVERALRFDREHMAYGFVVRGGALEPEDVPAAMIPSAREVLE